MSNLSQEKRKEMLEYINKLKEIHKDDESIIALEKIETALTEKKYGLVWEEHEEEVDKKLVHNIPVFTEVEDRKIIADENEGFNFLLEGDNLHSLKLLEKTHKGRIDVIYIDPPYNTGNKDFIYDDNYIGTDDGYRHSKWLSFMNERLVIAQKLLSDEGVIFISIDDNEQAQLKLLCDDIFGEKNFIGNLPRVTKKSGKDHSVGVAKNHDYTIVYAKDRDNASFAGIQAEDTDYPFKDEYYDQRGGYKLNQTLDYNSLWYNPKMDFPIEVNGEFFYPGGSQELHNKRHSGKHNPKDWVWRWSLEKFKFGLENGFIEIKEGKERSRIYTKTYANATISKKRPYTVEYIERETKLSSIALVDNIFSNDNAKKEITKLGLEKFGFPKPTSLIVQLILIIKYAHTILDFFAGSGTTGHAVMQLNKEDGGKRKYILCTNNENKICEEVTYKRLQNIQEELPHNLKYFKTDFTPKFTEEEDILSFRLLDHIKEMVELENMCEIDGVNRVIVLSDEELKEKLETIKEGAYLYIPAYILLTNETKKIFEEKKLNLVEIPEYYFMDELREAKEI